MKLLIGLGNPGNEYTRTRHNAGFLFLDAISEGSFDANKYVLSEVLKMTDGTVLAKPSTFMNDSGKAVKALMDYFHTTITDVVIIHDDLDVRLGEYKVQSGKGPKDHNGILSIEETLGTKDFLRVRVGVDNRDPLNRIPGEHYVLQEFTKEEIEALSPVFESIRKELHV